MHRALCWPRGAVVGVLVVLLVSLTALVAACGGGSGTGGRTPSGKTATPSGNTSTATPSANAGTPSGDEAAIEATIRKFFDDYNTQVYDGVIGVLTDKVLQEQLGVTRANAGAALTRYLGDPQLELTDIANIEVSGDTATADVSYKKGGVLLMEQEVLEKQDTRWLFDDFVPPRFQPQ